MQLEITPELAEVRSALRRFTTERLEPIAAEIDRSREIPQTAWDALREQGYLGMRLPEFGGGGFGLGTYCLALEEFSRSHRAFTLLLDYTSGLTPIAIARSGTARRRAATCPSSPTARGRLRSPSRSPAPARTPPRSRRAPNAATEAGSSTAASTTSAAGTTPTSSW